VMRRSTDRATACDPPGRNGFTLVELLIAVFILAMGLVFVFALFPVGIYSTRENVDDTRAAILARSALARMSAEFILDEFDTGQLRTLSNTDPDTFGALWTGTHAYGDGFGASDIRDTDYAQYCWLATYAPLDPTDADPSDTSPFDALRVCVAVIRLGRTIDADALVNQYHPDFSQYDAAVTLTAGSADATVVESPANTSGLVSGGWLCDLRSGRWYRILDIGDDDGNGSVDTVNLTREAEYDSNGVAGTFRNARFFPNVVTVVEGVITR